MICGEAPLKSLFPTLLSLTTDKNAMVSDYMSLKGKSVHWNPIFLRSFNDQELSSTDSSIDFC